MGKTVGIIQARMGSSRLPGKVLIKISGKPILEHIVDRLQLCESIDQIIIATTFLEEDTPILKLAEKLSVSSFSGPVENVFQRYVEAGKVAKADTVLRVCGDSPLIDNNFIDLMISEHLKSLPDISFAGTKIPLGTGAEVIQLSSLLGLEKLIKKQSHIEHVTPYFYDHPEKFRLNPVLPPTYLRESSFRLTVDTEEDMAVVQAIYDDLYMPKKVFSAADAITFLRKHPHISKINQMIRQKDWRDS